MKKLLAICSQAPYGKHLAKEAIDAVLATGVFDQALSVLFLDDGVFQLLNHQDATKISQKSVGAAISAFPLYDIEPIYVERESLEERGLNLENLVIDNLIPISRTEIGTLISEQHQILSF